MGIKQFLTGGVYKQVINFIGNMKNQNNNPHTKYPVPPFPKQDQSLPGKDTQMKPLADHGEESYTGSVLLPEKAQTF